MTAIPFSLNELQTIPQKSTHQLYESKYLEALTRIGRRDHNVGRTFRIADGARYTFAGGIPLPDHAVFELAYGKEVADKIISDRQRDLEA